MYAEAKGNWEAELGPFEMIEYVINRSSFRAPADIRCLGVLGHNVLFLQASVQCVYIPSAIHFRICRKADLCEV